MQKTVKQSHLNFSCDCIFFNSKIWLPAYCQGVTNQIYRTTQIPFPHFSFTSQNSLTFPKFPDVPEK